MTYSTRVSKNYLVKCLCLSVLLGGVTLEHAHAAIVFTDGARHDITTTVDITDTVTVNGGKSSIISGGGTPGTNIVFQKDVNINLPTLVTNGTYGGLVTAAYNNSIAVDGTLTISADTKNSTGGWVAGLINFNMNSTNMQINKYDLTLYGGNNNTIVGSVFSADIKESNIRLYAYNNTAAAYGYGDHFDHANYMEKMALSGKHTINIDGKNGKTMAGIYRYLDSYFDIKDNSNVAINIKNTNDGSVKWDAMNIQGVMAILSIVGKSQLDVTLDLPTASTYTYDPAKPGATLNYRLEHNTAGVYINIPIVAKATAARFSADSVVNITVSGAPVWEELDIYGSKFGNGSVVGLGALYNNVVVDGALNINVTSPKGVGVLVDDSPTIASGNIALNGQTIIKTNNGYALMSETIAYGDTGSKYAFYFSSKLPAARIDINKNGGSLVQIVGDLDHRSILKSAYSINLDRADSYLTGSSMHTNEVVTINYGGTIIKPTGTTDITLANSATWNMTGVNVNNASGNSIVNKLTFENKGYLNMTPSDGLAGHTYETLTANQLLGSNGHILMNTSLEASFDNKNVMVPSDHIIINTASAGEHTIDVKDASLLSKIAAEGYLLLVEDKSQGAATFLGGELKKGGIFKYKPIIVSTNPIGYNNVPLNATNWYLTGFEKDGPKEEPIVNAGLAESRYIAYMNEQDTLIKRLGELRQHDKTHGIWARIRGANNSVEGYGINRNSYVSTHLGYDWKLKEKEGAKAKRYVGLALNHTNNNYDYAFGANGKGQSNVLTVYGTRLGDKGHYLDLVGKIGRMSNDYKYLDQHVSAANWFYSLSAEYGRSIVRDKGWYYEPQIQFTYGHINGASYNSRETRVNANAIDSAILRAGLLFGRKYHEDKPEKMGSYYAKVFYNHEFGGNVKANMMDVYGDKFDFKHSYSGSWLTVGLGTSLNLNKKTNLYLDVEKAFGGKIKGGWAWQGGMRWRF